MPEFSSYQNAREHFSQWQQQLQDNILQDNSNLMHSYRCIFPDDKEFLPQLTAFSQQVSQKLETVVMENNLDANLPKVEHYDAIGEVQEHIIHHPSYTQAGDIIYGSNLMHYLLTPGAMKKTLSLFLLSSHAGEAGHNCPIACSAGVIRILSYYASLPQKQDYLQKLTAPSFTANYTGAQFLTEIQGGSDVGLNATEAYQDENQHWRIRGEKWFCSNANADLILLTARVNPQMSGTKGLGLFLIPRILEDGNANHYHIRRLKQKIGTRSMATAEIDFADALAYPMGELSEGINLVMENVLHLSRIFNTFSVLGMARRAQQIAYYYAKNRIAFGQAILNYPLVKETLALIKAENTAMLASAFHMVNYQDNLDCTPKQQQSKPQQLLLRTLANLNKYFSAKRSVENIHHCLDILAGNGTIESFSSLPRLLRDCLVCENWEGTHFTLWMQTLRDILRFDIDVLFIAHIEELCAQIDDPSVYHPIINHLREQFSALRLMPTAEQSLKIKDIIEKMATLLAALCLAIESEKTAPDSKKACLQLFTMRYLTQNNLQYEGYMTLLESAGEEV